jgi:hypothetical protein
MNRGGGEAALYKYLMGHGGDDAVGLIILDGSSLA